MPGKSQSHTAGPSAVYTVPAWTVTPSASAVFVIENNSDRILLWTSVSTSTFTYNIAANAWDITTFAARPAGQAGGGMSCPSFFIRPGAAGQSYTVTNRITTTGGRTEDRSFLVRVEQR